MKKNVLLLLACLIAVTAAHSQHLYQSSCNAHDTILKKYRKDAARLAVRHVHKKQLPYKDSLNVDRALQKRYLDALIAVYNATIFTSRDTVFNVYNIHTNNTPGLNALEISAADTVYWMAEFFANMAPTSNTTIAYYYNKYHMQDVYYQSQPLDKVVLSTDSILNMVVMQKAFAAVPGASSVTVSEPFSDSRNIIDTLDPNFIQLTFDYGWQNCLDTCEHHKYWTFKVYPDCKIEDRGQSGDALNTSILIQGLTERTTRLFPNPTSGKIIIHSQFPAQLLLLNGLGQRIMEKFIGEKESTIDLSDLPNGIYYLQLKGENNIETRKVIKE